MLPPKKDAQKAEQQDVPQDDQDDQGEKEGGGVGKPEQVAQADRPEKDKTDQPEADAPAEKVPADELKTEPKELSLGRGRRTSIVGHVGILCCG